MAIFKCKACNGNLDVEEGMSICECGYCGTRQTVPLSDNNEKKVNLFNRANRLRSGCDFDKAAGVYESIVAEFPEEAEAYWGLCLCRYGIEYVDDPATGKKIPTCHRAEYTGIFEDGNFELACEYADGEAMQLYRSEAKEIDRLQKEILEIANNEEPYDIFICYKETDEEKQRTKDSVLAQDMYDALTEKGYKVFFSRITLEDKLGQDYEPYIFSALNSAKVMLAVGTKFEHFNAVWVKNEWTRFLAMMKSDKSKTLIPCYCDIDAYDMPPEFKHLQGQDMSKVGFLQDLIRGIGKIIPKGAAAAPAAAVLGGNPTSGSLLERAFMFLGSNDWKSANLYCEKVLDMEPKNGRAYLGKLMAEFNCRREEELGNLCVDLTSSANYKNAVQFGVDLKKYATSALYNKACQLLTEADSVKSLKLAADYFKQTIKYKDSAEKLAECEDRLNSANGLIDELRGVYRSYDAAAGQPNAEELDKVIAAVDNIKSTYPKFHGNDIPEPLDPLLLNVWIIPLGIGLIVAGICSALHFKDPSQEETLAYVMMGALFVSMLAGGIANCAARQFFTMGYLGLMAFLSAAYAIIVGVAYDLYFEYSHDPDAGMKITLVMLGIGVLMIVVATLTIVLFCQKKSKIRRYFKANDRLEALTEKLNEGRERALAERLAKHPEFTDGLCESCLGIAQNSYKS